jgi:hypothetical protein
MDFDINVKLAIYRVIADTGKAPAIAQVAAKLGSTTVAIREAFQRLFAKRLLVLEPGTFEIRMAPPFSAVPTSFVVAAAEKSYFANCVWDAYGIAAALHQDVDVSTSCGCCGEPMTLAVRQGTPMRTPGIAHFAVPAAHWWDNIVYT